MAQLFDNVEMTMEDVHKAIVQLKIRQAQEAEERLEAAEDRLDMAVERLSIAERAFGIYKLVSRMVRKGCPEEEVKKALEEKRKKRRMQSIGRCWKRIRERRG